MYNTRESLYGSRIILVSIQDKKKNFTCKLTFCLSQEIELSIHCEVLWFITAEGRRPGVGDNSDGAVQGKLDETHFPES